MTTLHLTRRPRETIHIGDEISVTVTAVRGNQVRITVNAPATVTVDREEIWIRKKHEQQGCTCGPGHYDFSLHCALHKHLVQRPRVS